MGAEEHQDTRKHGKHKAAGSSKAILLTVIGLAGIAIMALGVFATHGSVQAHGFCNFCHSAYYDAKEYAFNEKVGMEKPSGMLTGCAECHPQPYMEFRKSTHFETEKLDRRPGCSNCHEPHSILLWYKYMYRQPDEWKRVQISMRDTEIWEKEVRPDLAKKARIKFVKSDSRACRGCHNEAAQTW